MKLILFICDNCGVHEEHPEDVEYVIGNRIHISTRNINVIGHVCTDCRQGIEKDLLKLLKEKYGKLL